MTLHPIILEHANSDKSLLVELRRLRDLVATHDAAIEANSVFAQPGGECSECDGNEMCECACGNVHLSACMNCAGTGVETSGAALEAKEARARIAEIEKLLFARKAV